MYENILVPLDRSETAEAAVKAAISMAKVFDGKIKLIHVLEILPLLPKARAEEYKALKTNAEKYLSEMTEQIEKSGVYAESVIKTGEPSLVICEYAKRHDVDIIIMSNGGSGRVWFDRWGIGSVAEKIVNQSPKHVLVVRSVSDNILRGRNILVVDDEPDILETIEETLDMCIIHKAVDHDSALEYINKNMYDIAILDIMGVGGFDLLEKTTSKGIPSVMLTAHAMTSESLSKAAKLGAVSFLPKEKIMELQSFLEDIIRGSGKPVWKKLFGRLAPYFRKRFGWSPEEEKDVVPELQEIDELWKKY